MDARVRTLLMAAALAAGVLAAGLLLGRAPARAQSSAEMPTPAFVVTTPTATATPTPFVLPTPTPKPGSASPLATPQATSVSAWALPITAQQPAAETSATQPLLVGDGYIVQAGDTLLDAALELGLNVDEVGCVLRPSFDPTLPLVIGDRLAPLPAGLRCVTTLAGESVRSLAERFGIAPESILAEPWNELAALPSDGATAQIDQPLAAGRFVRVPAPDEESGLLPLASGADDSFVSFMLAQPAGMAPTQALGAGGVRRPAALAPVPADWPYGSGHFAWPTYGFLTQSYSFDHRALDIAAPAGSPVTAADRGVVLRAGWNNQGYGTFVIVDHNIDYLTLYAHLDEIFVNEGEIVVQGQLLGTVGSTGNSTGPHLHFELRDFGRLANPLEYLGR